MRKSQEHLHFSIQIPQRRRLFRKPISVNVSIPVRPRRTRFVLRRLIRNYIIRSQLNRIGVPRHIRASLF